jgi:hypothetical protein
VFYYEGLQQFKSHVLTVWLSIPFNELPEFKYFACQVCNVAATFAEKKYLFFFARVFFSPRDFMLYSLFAKSLNFCFDYQVKWNKIGDSTSVIEFTPMTFFKSEIRLSF